MARTDSEIEERLVMEEASSLRGIFSETEIHVSEEVLIDESGVRTRSRFGPSNLYRSIRMHNIVTYVIHIPIKGRWY